MFAGPAKRYFNFMGKAFPVLCASGKLTFIPSSHKAASCMDRFEDFSTRSMAKKREILEGFLKTFEECAAKASGKEKALNNALAANVRGVLLELFQVRPWETLPQIYPLIAFTGVYHALTLPMDNQRKRLGNLCKRLRAIPPFLAQVQDNVETVTPFNRGTAQTMTRHCARYLKEITVDERLTGDKNIPHLLEGCLQALRNYDRHIISRPQVESHPGPDLDTVLHEAYANVRPVAEIFELADEQWRQAKNALESIASEFGFPDWRSIYDDIPGLNDLRPCDNEENEHSAHERIFDCLRRETETLGSTFRNMTGNNHVPDIQLTVEDAPSFMTTMNGPIRYCPPPAPAKKNQARLLVTPAAFYAQGLGSNDGSMASIRKGARIALARETWPGRHVLACHRLASTDTVTAQLRNPLMEAGWMVYTEDLLLAGNYLETPDERVALERHRLYRATRCMVDTGLATGHADQNRCTELLEQCGMSRDQALREIRDICMRPGREIVPVLGRAILKEMHQESGLSSGDFRAAFLAGGETSPEMTLLRINSRGS